MPSPAPPAPPSSTRPSTLPSICRQHLKQHPSSTVIMQSCTDALAPAPAPQTAPPKMTRKSTCAACRDQHRKTRLCLDPPQHPAVNLAKNAPAPFSPPVAPCHQSRQNANSAPKRHLHQHAKLPAPYLKQPKQHPKTAPQTACP